MFNLKPWILISSKKGVLYNYLMFSNSNLKV